MCVRVCVCVLYSIVLTQLLVEHTLTECEGSSVMLLGQILRKSMPALS